MADIKISELNAATSLNNGDLVEVSQVDEFAPSGYSSKKATMTDLGEKVANGIEYTSELHTSNKKIIGAINEIATYTPVYGNTASGAIATFDTSLALPLQDCTIEINAVQESGTPTPSSPKAISGFTGANIVDCGVNLWNEVTEIGGIAWTTGQNSGENDRLRSKNYIQIEGGTTYAFSYTSVVRYIWFYDNTKTLIENVSGTNNFLQLNINVATFTAPSNACYCRFILWTTYGTTYNNDVSISYPATDTAYHAYNANSTTTPITWQSEAGTVYGGSLDVTKGLLTVTHKIEDMGDLNYTHYSVAQGDLFRASLSDVKQITNQYVIPSALSDIYSATDTTARTNYTLSQAINNPSIDFVNNDYSDAPSFKTAMSGHKLVYELATPVTYQLTPTQISAIVGTNNVFTDTNGNTSVVYVCSLKDYIDSQ